MRVSEMVIRRRLLCRSTVCVCPSIFSLLVTTGLDQVKTYSHQVHFSKACMYVTLAHIKNICNSRIVSVTTWITTGQCQSEALFRRLPELIQHCADPSESRGAHLKRDQVMLCAFHINSYNTGQFFGPTAQVLCFFLIFLSFLGHIAPRWQHVSI